MRKATYCSLGLSIALLLGIFPVLGFTQAQRPAALVIEGGTLIDGNGGGPVQDSVIVIQGNQITNVSRKGQVSYPANAQVIKADGKFVLPGLWDAQVSYQWYYGEVMLSHGITSTIDVGNSGEIAVPHRDAVMQGKVRGPRTFTGISRIAKAPEGGTGLETVLSPTRAPKSAEETRELVRTFIAAGADIIMFQDGSLPMEYYRAGFEEARKAGKPVFTRAYGPILSPKEAALMGSANLPHSAGIGAAVTKTPPAGRNDSVELDLYADMDDAKARELIQILVQNKTALTPTFKMQYPGYPRDSARFEEEDRRLLSDPNLLAYYPPNRVLTALGSYSRIDRGAVRERRMKGFQNALRLHKIFADAGGRLIPGANTNATKVPGNNLHHEMQILAEEAGVAPMQIIQGATKWSAEMINKGNLLGTVEAGKLADVIIVNENPLQGIRNLQKIDTVIFDGKVVDRGYHPWYTDPFRRESDFNPPVEALQWVTAFKRVMFGEGPGEGRPAGPGALRDPVESPQPAIETISPVMVTEGSPALAVTIKGFNFVRRSQVYFKGISVPYRVVSPTELQVAIDASLLREVGWFDLVVKNPWPLHRETGEPWGNGTSNKAHLIVNYKY